MPSAANSLMPLYSGGLCDAEITTPRRRPEVRRQERDGGCGLDADQDHVTAGVADSFV